MIKKSDKIICACITLMLERNTSQLELKDVLFTRTEIYERALELFAEGRLTSLEFRKYVVGFGADSDEDCLIHYETASFVEYYRLCCPQSYNEARIIDILLSSRWQNRTRFKSLNAIKNLLNQYFSREYPVPLQPENKEIITREAIWIAAATLTYNEYYRTRSRNQEKYQFSQVTIAKVANSYNTDNGIDTCRQMVRVQCTEGRSRQPYSYLVDVGGEGRDNRRRISYFGEFEYTQPDIHKDFQVATIMGNLTVGEIEDFIHHIYSPIFFRNLTSPLDASHTKEEMEQQAANMDFESLRAAAIERGEEHPSRTDVTTYSYERDPYIARYAKVRACGFCQLCGCAAPFKNANGEPYLETHHIIWLSQGGADTADNVVALCPNCHRKMHIVKSEEDILMLRQLVLSGK